ncbi:MAG: TRAP transporter large permease [Pseudomonadota bacterium]
MGILEGVPLAWQAAIFGFGGVLTLIMVGIPIAFAMLGVGMVGVLAIVGPNAVMGMAGQLPFTTVVSYDLSVVPMFVLMGVLVARAGMSEDIYRLCHGFLGHRRGGLASATVVACGGFSAVCGSSIATVATMGKVAMPEMRRFGYGDALASGAVAAGGTLGILIPPSVILVLYGIATGTDIGALFIAGIVPGILAILLYVAAIWIIATVDPSAGPVAPRVPWRERLAHLKTIGPIVLLFLVIIGGIYFGVFTPTEAAGIGAFFAFLFALWRRALTVRLAVDVLIETVTTTAALFVVLIGALFFGNFMNLAGLPEALKSLIAAANVSPLGVILIILAIYMILGCFMESLSMMLLTVPIFFPVVVGELGYDAIWFGIFVVMVTELSLVTPPVGLNLFVLRSVIQDVSMGTVYRGILPFVAADAVRLAIIIAVPGLVLALPQLMS